ncbi:ataxin-7-like protein 1 isoform X5 [Clarias magur]|uniref:Ataxin-7-like protein 1 isoform X5 n=1 Tax=Clarias magur TaxID=1594786 RepID=A0A8J4TVZ4_CLAMG|nr:ataxin-7-like protein 1 isoform X5 [Clarias magur]
MATLVRQLQSPDALRSAWCCVSPRAADRASPDSMHVYAQISPCEHVSHAVCHVHQPVVKLLRFPNHYGAQHICPEPDSDPLQLFQTHQDRDSGVHRAFTHGCITCAQDKPAWDGRGAAAARMWMWFQGVVLGCGFRVWFRGVVSGCGFGVWFLGVILGCGFRVWFLGVVLECGFEVWFRVWVHVTLLCL